MKALPKRKGNFTVSHSPLSSFRASMKALPKRKGNLRIHALLARSPGLNESPSEKEGKLGTESGRAVNGSVASMKALPKRKGNDWGGYHQGWRSQPQ